MAEHGPSEADTWTLARRSGDAAASWHAVSATEARELAERGWETVTVVELAAVVEALRWSRRFDAARVVEEPRLREAEAERDLMERANETSMELADDLAGDVERLEAELREAREALADIVKLGTSYQRHLHRQLPGQPPPDPHYHDEPVYSPEACRARGVVEKDTRGG